MIPIFTFYSLVQDFVSPEYGLYSLYMWFTSLYIVYPDHLYDLYWEILRDSKKFYDFYKFLHDWNKNETRLKKRQKDSILWHFMTLYVKYIEPELGCQTNQQNQKNTLHFLVYFNAHNF